MDDDAPDEELIRLAGEGAAFVQKQGGYLSDLIYGHYRYAQKEGWLSFWSVPAGLAKPEALRWIHSVEIHVTRDRDEDPVYHLAIHVNPKWDEEHKLHFRLQDGAIVSANDESFSLRNGVLKFR